MRLAGLVAVAVAACAGLLALLAGHLAVSLHRMGDPRAATLAFDAVILGAGLAGLMLLLGFHLRGVVLHPLREATRRARVMAASGVDEHIPERGMGEMHELAVALNQLTEHRAARQRRSLHEADVNAMGAVLAGLAHELRNPVAVLRLQAGLLQAADDARHGPIMKTQDAMIARLEEVVSALEEAGGGSTDCDLDRIVRAALITAHRALDVELETRLEARRRAACDGRALVQALVAVVINALEAMPAGGTLRVTTRDEDDDDAVVVVEVQDTGPGVPPEIREHVFNPFTTTKPGRPGLGLTLCRTVVEEHGGSVTLEVGDGTTVRLRLPAAAPSRPPSAPQTA